MKKLLAFGEVLFDIIEGEAFLGGAPFNVAAHFARHNNSASLISAVGNDELGKKVLKEAQNYRVETSFIQSIHDFETGKVEVRLKNGQPDYTILEPVAWDFISLDSLQTRAIREVEWDCFCFGLLAQRNAVSEKTLHEIFDNIDFGMVFFDINLRKNFFTQSKIEYSLQKCNILKLNVDEVNFLSSLLFYENLSRERFSELVSVKYNIDIVVVTMGEKGAMLYQNGEVFSAAAPKIEVTDAVGAGDSFSAAFLNEYLESENSKLALQKACELGAFVASKRGALPRYNF